MALDPPYELSVRGEVEEGALFCPHLRLTTTYTTAPGSNRLVIHDVVENRSAQPAEMQMLYHCNFGPPFLEAGSRVLAPVREMAPQTPRAAEGIDSYETYAGPTAGFAEQVYVYDLLADDRGHTLSVLVNTAQDRAVAVRFNRNELPCFTVWKNTGAVGGRLRHRTGAGDQLSELQGLRAQAGPRPNAAAGRALGESLEPGSLRYGRVRVGACWRRWPCCRATPRPSSIERPTPVFHRAAH